MRLFLLLAPACLLAAPVQAPVKSLSIVDASVQQFEDGPPAGSEPFRPGETVFFSFQIKGYTAGADGKVQLNYRIEVLDPDDVPLVPAETGRVETELTEQDKEWLPKVRHSFLAPSHALSGRIRILATAKDGRTGAEAKSETPFNLVSRQVETGGPLAVRNIRFFGGEDETTRLVSAVYHAGETLWARFDITGFKLGESNRLQVSYGLAIISPSGKQLFSEP